MTEDITSLQIRILYDSVTEAERRLRTLEGTSGRTERSINRQNKSAGSLMGTLGKLAAGYITLRGVVAGFQAVIRKTAEFQQLNAQLVTATGSAENAVAAFAAIKDFAQQTPYDLQQATGAFISLVNRGLEPSERALRAYGDTASSMGFQLSEMVLAVSNATAGEFENLKRFGIRAQKEGDNVKFTFRGVTTEVKNNIEDIERYFIELGETSFAGGMERQMNTLTGAFSNLGDAWEVLLATIGEEGLGDFVEDSIRNVTALVEELIAMLESGQVQAAIDGWAIAFGGYVEDVSFGVGYLNEILQGHGEQGEETGQTLFEGLMGGMKAAVIGYRAYVKSMGTILWGLVDSAVQVGKAIFETIAAAFNGLITSAAIAGKAIGQALNPFSSQTFSGSIKAGYAGIASEIEGAANKSRLAWDDSFVKIGINSDVVVSGLADAWKEAGDNITQAALLQAEANQKREQYDKDAEARALDRADRLKRFGIKSGGTGGGTAPTASRGGRGGGGGSRTSEFETLEKSLRDEETLISESYARRFQLIEDNTRQGSAYQAELQISLTEQFAEEQQKRVDLMKEQPETMFQAYAEEERIIQESYERRKDIILNATELTEREKLKMLEEAELQYTAAMRKHEIERNEMQLGIAADFFGNIAAMSAAFGSKGAKIAKAAAIAETTINTYKSATAAYASLAGIPYVGPALGAAAAGAAIAAGFANIQAIKAQDASGGYAGAYENGGYIPGGKFGLVGEAGPEFVQGPAMVTSARQSAAALAQSGGKAVIVNITNQAGVDIEKTGERETQDNIIVDFIVKKAVDQSKRAIASDIRTGGNEVSKSMEGTFGLSRARR